MPFSRSAANTTQSAIKNQHKSQRGPPPCLPYLRWPHRRFIGIFKTTPGFFLSRSVMSTFDVPDFPPRPRYAELTQDFRLDYQIFSRGFSSATPASPSVIYILHFWKFNSDPLFRLANGRWTRVSTCYTVSTQIKPHNRICHADPRSEADLQVLLACLARTSAPCIWAGAGAGAGAGQGEVVSTTTA